MNDIQHPDGIWHTTVYFYKGYRYVIKSRKDHGIKIHVFHRDIPEKVLKTFRYKYVELQYLKNKVEKFIDNLMESK